MKRTGSPTAQAPHEASGHQTLSAYIQARFDEFSRSQKDVAQYIVDHLDEVAFQTAEELARRANTSSSTVVRFSQALGFEGFPELQSSARDEYRRRVAHDRGGRSDAGAAPLFSLDQSDVETAVAADQVNVEDTARRMSRRSRRRPPGGPIARVPARAAFCSGVPGRAIPCTLRTSARIVRLVHRPERSVWSPVDD